VVTFKYYHNDHGSEIPRQLGKDMEGGRRSLRLRRFNCGWERRHLEGRTAERGPWSNRKEERRSTDRQVKSERKKSQCSTNRRDDPGNKRIKNQRWAKREKGQKGTKSGRFPLSVVFKT